MERKSMYMALVVGDGSSTHCMPTTNRAANEREVETEAETETEMDRVRYWDRDTARD